MRNQYGHKDWQQHGGKTADESPWRDHIIGFKRKNTGIDLVLDEEGQAKWKAKEREIQAWCDKYGSD